MGKDRYDSLGDRMKMYESQETQRRFIPTLPVYARIDGRSFSSFTRGMKRPFDEQMTNAMIETTKALVKQTNAVIGYTQSDEISLMWYSPNVKSSIFFDGKIQKINSQLAAIASVYFLQEAQKYWPEKLTKGLPTFDSRVFSLPSKEEAVNCFLWREWDATKNSYSMAAHSYYSAKQLHGKNSSQKQEMLFAKGLNWNDYPTSFKRGTYVKRVVKDVKIDDETWAKIPDGKKPESRMAKRSFIEVVDVPPLASVENRAGFFFDGEDPLVCK